MYLKKYDIIVIGGGHAGCEAAAATSNLGLNTLLITMDLQNIGQMSCNPAMGGIAKGQIIREIDALGGQSAIITDKTMIQFRMLNKSKGPAMWSPRAQSDRKRFSEEWKITLEKISTLDFFQEEVVSLLIDKDNIVGVKTSRGIEIKGNIVILTNGTFLNGILHIGNKKIKGGRISEKSSTIISEQLKNLGFQYGRMKTGTPPRVDRRSLDFSKMIEQSGDKYPKKFSYLNTPILFSQKSCYITYTNTLVHDTILSNIDKSPIFNGSIKAIGPRYCPSIEDKIYRFSNNPHHHIFVEPEGINSIEMYINGFSTSLPEEVQYESLKYVPGFEYVKFFRPGYAIEYDFFYPTQLKHSLETKKINNLFFAGQINGTTGYEEAAAQGLIAGINAYLKIVNKEPFILKRNQAYIGVLIDDLVTKGTKEPYRMFTSHAEYRILLRQDNADQRLTHLSYKIGLASKNRIIMVEEKKDKIKKCISFFKRQKITPKEINPLLEEKKSSQIIEKNTIDIILSRPEININDLLTLQTIINSSIMKYLEEDILEQISILIKYRGYIEKEEQNANKLLHLESILIPKWIKYEKIPSLSYEAKEKLILNNPISIGDASRISGVSPSDINILLIYIKH